MKRFIKLCVILTSSFSIASCSTSLTKEAQQIMTIKDGGVIAMMNCKALGFVEGDSGPWGGSAGLDMAFADAKNKAALLPKANTILITSSQKNPTSIVNAKVFDCSQSKPQQIEIVKQPIAEQEPKEDIKVTIEKAKKCQSKDGAWLNGQCVISID